MAESLNIRKFAGISKGKVFNDERLLHENEETAEFKSLGKNLYNILQCNYPKYYKMDKLSKLTFLGAEIINREVDLKQFDPERTGIILSNSASTYSTDCQFTDTVETIPSPAVFVYTLPNIATGELSIRHGWKGENLFLVEAAFSAERLIEQTELLFEHTNINVCLTGWTDYISEENYKACLWLVQKNNGDRKFSGMELLNDFNLSE